VADPRFAIGIFYLEEQMDAEEKLGILIDLGYAIRQLRQFRDIGRALDALERVKSVLEASGNPLVEADTGTFAERSPWPSPKGPTHPSCY
jgi:hypothetical protein